MDSSSLSNYLCSHLIRAPKATVLSTNQSGQQIYPQIPFSSVGSSVADSFSTCLLTYTIIPLNSIEIELQNCSTISSPLFNTSAFLYSFTYKADLYPGVSVRHKASLYLCVTETDFDTQGKKKKTTLRTLHHAMSMKVTQPAIDTFLKIRLGGGGASPFKSYTWMAFVALSCLFFHFWNWFLTWTAVIWFLCISSFGQI